MFNSPSQPFEFDFTHYSVPPPRADSFDRLQLRDQAHLNDHRFESPSPEAEHEYTDRELIDFYFGKTPNSPSAEPLVSISFPSTRTSPNRPPTEVASFFPPGYVIPPMSHQLDYNLDIIERIQDSDFAVYIGKPSSDPERSEDFWFVRVVDAVGRLVHEANPRVRVYCTEHLESPLELWNGEPAGISAWPCARHKRWVVKYGMKKVIEFGGRYEETVVQMPYIRSRRAGVNGSSLSRTWNT